jgi:hypothetical protein
MCENFLRRDCFQCVLLHLYLICLHMQSSARYPPGPHNSTRQSDELTFFPCRVDEGALRRSLFENTGGSFPELITRPDIKVFLPPIGGLTVYCFGDPAKMSDPNVKLALRVHDECNGSDVFGSDICTCRPYLLFGIEEAVKEAQSGGSGVVIYFRKEGRALGEVTKVWSAPCIVLGTEADISYSISSIMLVRCSSPYCIPYAQPIGCN